MLKQHHNVQTVEELVLVRKRPSGYAEFLRQLELPVTPLP